MAKKRFCIFIINVSIVFIISASDVSVGEYKPKYKSNFTRDGSMYHVAFFEQNVKWDEADVTCKVHYGYLFSKLSTTSTLYSELKSIGVDNLWTGIHRKENYYIQDGMRYQVLFKAHKAEKYSSIIGEQWAFGEDLSHDCVVLNIKNGELMTQNCSLHFPFVCESEQTLEANNEGCPDNWYMSPALSITGRKCISEAQKARSYRDAEFFCSVNKWRLPTANEYTLLKMRKQLHSKRSNEEFWARNADDNSTCTYQLFRDVNGTHEHPPCTNTLPFICVKSVEPENLDVFIEVGLSVNSVDPCQIFPWNSTCETKDMIICSTKNHDPEKYQFQWFIDDVPAQNPSYAFRLSYLGDGFKWTDKLKDQRKGEANTKQGSYHCEVRVPGSARSYRSKRIDLFYPDVSTYIIDIDGIGRENYVDYSQSTFNVEMNKINEVINTILRMKNVAWDFKSIRKTGESYSMKLAVFLNRSSDFDDDIAFMNVKRSFKENAPMFQLGKNITLTVHSADVCFQSDIKPNEACGEIKWPTTKQVKNVLTETACLNEHKKYVHRECKGSSLTKAKWSSFDCSVCKDFRKRFQDETIQCPYGYKKIKNRDICFKIHHDEKNWFDAHKTCSNFSSYLLDVPIDSEIDTVNSLWLSYKYSHGQIQGFGQKPINLKILYEKEEELIENIDMKNHEFYCVSAVREISGFKFKFENCNTKMPFVCVKRFHEIVNSDTFASTSVKLYKQSNHAEPCYYLENIPYSWTEATEFCEHTLYGAKLLNGVQDSDSYNYLKKLIIDQYSNEIGCDSLAWWMDFEDVIQRGMPPNLTYVDWGPSADFNTLDPHGVITLFPDKKVYWSLEKSHKKLGVICKIRECHDNRPIGAYIERRSLFQTNSTEDPLEWLKGFQFKCIPSGLYVADSISWYKDGNFGGQVSPVFCFDKILNNFNLSDQAALEYQGYYSCSADAVENKKAVHSSEQLIRIPGFQTFVLSMKSDEEIYLIDCPKYILSNSLRENTALYKCFNEHWRKSLNFNSYHFLLKSVICHSSYIDIKVHVYFKTHDPEEKMLEMIQKADFSNFSEVCKIDSKSVSAMSTAFCYDDEVSLGDVVLRWPSTEVGKSSFPDQICLTNESTLIERRCMGDFNFGVFWSNISITKCRETNSPITKKLINVLNSEDIISLLPGLPNLTSNPDLLQPSDVQVTVEILRSLANHEESFPSDNLPEVVRTLSNIIDVDQEVLSVVTNYSNRAVSYLERIASNIDEEVSDRNISTKNVQVNVYPFNPGELEVPNGFYIFNSISSSVFNASSEDLESNMKVFEAGIVVPNSLLHQKSNVSDRLVYMFSRNIYQQENVSVLSIVISVSLHNVSVYDLGRESMTLLFKLNSVVDNNNQKYVRCVSWDDDLNIWSYKGCFLRNISQDSVICACNHLTSFTVIMIKLPPPPAHETSLKYITYIGGSLSCIGLGLIMLTFLCFREWRKSFKNKCLFNFSLSHFLFLAVYMAAIRETDSVEWCKIIAIFLHYFLLSSFTWMVVLAYSVYLSLVKVFSTYIPCLIQKAMAFAYGLPVIIVIAVLSHDHKNYAEDKLCWLSQDAFTYGIIIPLVLMLVINYIIFGLILYVNTCGTQYVACNQKRQKLLITRAKALLCTSVLLGLSWIFGFFAMGTMNESQIFFMYLFAITTTFQGFLLAVFFILLPKTTRQSWIKFISSPAVTIKLYSSHNSSDVTKQV